MKISVILEALTGGFETDMKRAQKASEKAFAQMKKDAQASNVAIGNFFTGAAVAAGAAAVGVGYAVKSAVNEMDNLSKTAQKIGVTTEALSAMQYAAELADVDIGQLQGGMTRLVKAQAAVAEGSKKQAELFEALGVQVLNADGTLRDADQVMADLADRFAAMEDGSEKTAAAVAIFGRAGADLIPLLNGGAQGFRDAAREAEQFGLIVSTEAGRAAEEFNDSITRMGNAIEGAGVQLATELLPVLNDLATRVVNMAKDPAFRSELAQAIKTVGEFAIDAAQGIVTMTNVLGFLWDEAKQFVGLVDPADLVRQYEKLDGLRGQLAGMESGAAGSTGGQTPQAQALRDEIAAIEANIAAQESLLNARARIDSELQEIDLSTLPQRKQGPAPALFRDTTGEDAAAKEAARAARDAARDLAEEQKESVATVRALKLEALGAEAAAVAALQDKYGDLDKAVKLGTISQEEAAKVAAGLARQWQEDQTGDLRLSMLDEEQRAVVELQMEYTRLQNLIASGALTQDEGAAFAAKMAEDWAEEQRALSEQQFDALSAGLLTEEEEIQRSYERRREAILDAMRITEEEKTELLLRAEEERSEALRAVEQAAQMERVSAAASIAESLASITKDSMGEQSKAYRVMFAISKGFAVAEAAVALAQNVANASKVGFPQNLPMIAGAFAQGAQIMSILSGANYSGAYDRGGSIPAGSIGLVGERGPELIAGPATVTSRLQTAAMLQQGGGDGGKSVRIVNAIDPAFIADYLGSSDGEQAVLNVVGRNSRRVRSVLG